VIPFLNHVVKGFGVTNPTFWLGIILGAQGFGVFFGQILFGRVSDTHGPKLALIIALVGTAATLFLTGFCESITTLLVARFIGGLANPATPALSWVLDTTPPEKRKLAVSHFMLALVGGWGGGLALGAVPATFKETCIGVSIATLFAVVAICFAPAPPSSKDKAHASANDDNGSIVMSTNAWKSTALLNWTLGVALGGVIFGLSTVTAQDPLPEGPGWGWPVAGTSAMFGAAVVMILLNTFFIYPKLLDRFGTYQLAIMGSLLLAGALVLMNFTDPTPYTYLPTFALATLALTTAQPAVLSTAVDLADSMSPSSKGVVLGFTRGLDELGRACGPLIATPLYEIKHILGVLVPGMMLSIAAALFYLYVHPDMYVEEDVMPEGVDFDASDKAEKYRVSIDQDLRTPA
jgi:MFS family permease